MSFFSQPFYLKDMPEKEEYGIIPPGMYDAIIDNVELKDTKSGTGQYIAVTYKILGPTFGNRLVFSNINIHNQNEDAQRIGLAMLGSVMKAGGLTVLNSPQALVGIQCKIKITIRNDPRYGESNDVKDVKSISLNDVNATAGFNPISFEHKQTVGASDLNPPPFVDDEIPF